MTKYDIVDALARSQAVEDTVRNIARTPVVTYDLQDLVQLVYLNLLELPEEKVIQLDADGQMHYYIAGVVRRQLTQQRSRYRAQVAIFREKSVPLTEAPEV